MSMLTSASAIEASAVAPTATAASASVRVNRFMTAPRCGVRAVKVRQRNHSVMSEIRKRITSVSVRGASPAQLRGSSWHESYLRLQTRWLPRHLGVDADATMRTAGRGITYRSDGAPKASRAHPLSAIGTSNLGQPQKCGSYHRNYPHRDGNSDREDSRRTCRGCADQQEKDKCGRRVAVTAQAQILANSHLSSASAVNAFHY